MKTIHTIQIVLLVIAIILISLGYIIDNSNKDYIYDVNRDGIVNVEDCLVIQKYILTR